MIPLLPLRVHAWLDEAILPLYLVLAAALGIRGPLLAVLIYAGVQHFVVTRTTDYPRGTWKWLPLRVQLLAELGEGCCSSAPRSRSVRRGT